MTGICVITTDTNGVKHERDFHDHTIKTKEGGYQPRPATAQAHD